MDGPKKTRGVYFRSYLLGSSLKVGDKVLYRNVYGMASGPYKILAFKPIGEDMRCVYLNSASYWLPADLNRLERY